MENFNNAKIPPNSLQSEQSVIGGLLSYNDAWDDISTIISIEDFYNPSHKIIFEAVKILIEHNQPADALTVKEQLLKTNDEESFGGFAYLATITHNTPSVENIKSYAEHVRELSIYRQLIKITNEIADDAYHPKKLNIDELIDRAETKIFAIAEQIAQNKSNLTNTKESTPSFVKRIEYRQENPGISGIKTGFTEFDKLTKGLQNGDLIIIAGRPSMGKTAFSMNMVEHITINENTPVLVFSIEMPTEQLLMRMVSSSFKIKMGNMQDGNMTVADCTNFNQAVQVLESIDLYIDETPSPTPSEIRSISRRVKKRLVSEGKDLGLIVVDYLGLMQVLGVSDNRNLEISIISRSLKALAKELNIPVIALSQLNRGVESRPKAGKGRMPQMSDLRDSGSIEQDADIVAFMYRDEAYHDENFSNPEEVGKADLKIAKHRNGPTGFIKLGFNAEFARFENPKVGVSDYNQAQIDSSYSYNNDMENITNIDENTTSIGEYAKSD